MKYTESKVIDINDYRQNELFKDDSQEDKERTLSDSFYEDLREQKRKEKGLLWD